MLIEQILNFAGHPMYPIMAQNNLIKSIEALKNTISQRFPRSSVVAAMALPEDASTDVIDINRLSQKNTSSSVQNVSI